MSLDNLGNKQTIILHNCEINNKKYDLVITPHTQSIEYIRKKRQTIIRKLLSKPRQITQRRFPKRKNAVSESETINLEELYRLKDSAKKNYQVKDTQFFSDSETTSQSSIQGNRRKKDIQKQTSTSIQLESTNKRH